MPQSRTYTPKTWGALKAASLACVLAWTTGAFAAACPDSDYTPPYPRIDAIDRIAQRAIAQVPLAGLSIAVVRGSRLVHSAGYGYANLELGVPATPHTVYRIGSITKQFTAAVILRLVENDQIGLDDDIRKFLPDYDTGGRAVTIRQLLNHTSGIKNITSIAPAMANRSLDVTREQVFGWLSREPFEFEPGERYVYNNSGYWLLGAVIEQLTGSSYGSAIEQKLLAPLCLKATRYDTPRAIVPGRASGYVRADGLFLNAEPNSPTRPYASGALLSTVLDLVKWQRALFGGQVVGDASLRLMTTPGRLNNGDTIPYGLGLGIAEFRGHRRIAHPGDIVGFSGFLSYYPEHQLLIAALTNTMGVQLRSEIEQPIAAALLPRPQALEGGAADGQSW